jgi:glycosyltransferase involved in cell wall biosynthesis
MRILQLISSGGVYGAEHMMLTLTQVLVRQGHDCTVAVFENSRQGNVSVEVARHMAALDLPVQAIPCKGRLDFAAVACIRRLLQERRVDVLHAHGYKADIYGYIAARGTKIATVSTCHNWVGGTLALSIFNNLDRLVLQRLDAVVAVSEPIAGALRKCGVAPQKLRHISNGIDIHRFATAQPALRQEFAPHSGPLVGFVGRLSPEKGTHTLLHAAAVVLRGRPEAIFVLVGNGPERESLEQKAADLGISKSIRFLGQRNDMPDIYASLDILILPSLTEGLPLTILEALAAGRAVIATSVGAVPKVVAHEKTGLLVPPGDVEALAAAIMRLLDDSFLGKRLGRLGHDTVAGHYSAEVMAKEYLTTYDDAITTKTAYRKSN